MEIATFGFRIHKIWKILMYFAEDIMFRIVLLFLCTLYVCYFFSNQTFIFFYLKFVTGPSGIGRYTSDPLNWKSAVAVTSLHYFAGMAIIFGLAIETPILALVFVVTLIPFWCLSRRTTTNS